jgi:MinD superfamily P-loop ATPase
MRIAVASGKGGTGKTMVATSLATCLAQDFSLQFLDCDVEAPNAHLFLKPEIKHTFPAIIQRPQIIKTICTHCGRCVDVCEYNALAIIGQNILVFPQLCHGCGSCARQCPERAIIEKPGTIGTLSIGKTSDGFTFGMGELTIGEPMPTPIIRQLKVHMLNTPQITILDTPPGASCSVVATIHDADFVLLVTEPTPFGLHDLKQMLGILAKTETPHGVIINRDGIGNTQVTTYLAERCIPVLMRIPYRVEIASGLAAGQLMTEILPDYEPQFIQLYQSIIEIVHQKREAW